MSNVHLVLALKKGPALDALGGHVALQRATEKYEREEGTLFLIPFVLFDPYFEHFLAALEDFEDDHLLIGLNHVKPTLSDDYDSGRWVNNPFELRRIVEVRAHYVLD